MRQSNDFDDYPFLDPDYNKNVQRNDDGTKNVTNTYWTDAFLYWLDNTEVVEGSLLAFFSDIS